MTTLYSWGTLVNFAEGSPTWQSSHWSKTGGFAYLAVDGINDPNWISGSCSCTTDFQVTVPPVWAVDLGHTVNIYRVEVLNRAVLPGKLIYHRLRPRQSDDHFANDICKCILLNEKSRISYKLVYKNEESVNIGTSNHLTPTRLI